MTKEGPKDELTDHYERISDDLLAEMGARRARAD